MQGNVLPYSYHGEDEGSDGMHTKSLVGLREGTCKQ